MSSTAISTAIRWAVLERIYSFIGMDIDEPICARLSPSGSRKSPNCSTASTRYNLADYGMTAERVREQYGDYIQRFDLVEKSR